MFIDEEVYLEHYGVKGMKWGVRRERRKAKLAAMTPKERAAAKRKRKRRINNGISLALGAIWLGLFLSEKGSRPPPRDFPNKRRAQQTVDQIINAERDLKIDAIIRTHREGHIDKEQMQNFVDAMNKRYDRKVKDALDSLK